MTAMKSLLGRMVRSIAPETMRNLEYAGSLRQLSGRLPEVVQRVDELQSRVERIERRLADLDGVSGAVDELRGDSLRIAELTDLVVSTLAAERRGSEVQEYRHLV